MNSLGGPDLLLYLVLAFGGAMFIGNLMALARPPVKHKGQALPTAPKGRTVAMMVVGGIVSLWSLATLLTR